VSRADGSPVGEIAQDNVFGKIRFAFLVNGQQIGGIQAENWRAWNFAVTDHTGAEIARITKTWEGLAKTMFTTADNYVVQVHRPLPDPLASLVVASTLTVDTALKQDSRGFG
jgi:Neuraminidase (sialidase)